MAPLPKRRHSTQRSGKRKATISLRPPALVPCPNCQELHLPHQVCPECGFYKGKAVVQAKIKKERKKA